MELLYKYPKTLHIPQSPGTQLDDKKLSDMSCFQGNEVIITEKMDGENTSMYRTYFHARSTISGYHPSRSFVKQLWGNIAHEIPTGYRICGENLFAEHSIHYDNLTAYFLAFSVWNDKNECFHWDDGEQYCRMLGLQMVPEIYRGLYNEKIIQEIIKWIDVEKQEGFVIRNVRSFHFKDFQSNLAKWVRPNHVQTDAHWMEKPVVKNNLRN
jgi:hypothetical protein